MTLFYEGATSSTRVYVPQITQATAHYGDVDTDLLWTTVLNSWSEQGVEIIPVDELEDGYQVLQLILARIERIGAGNYLASFEEANIAISGEDSQEAYQNLVAEILDTFDTLLAEERLSPAAVNQLAALRNYIVKAQPADVN